jgi:hypothetical protein
LPVLEVGDRKLVVTAGLRPSDDRARVCIQPKAPAQRRARTTRDFVFEIIIAEIPFLARVTTGVEDDMASDARLPANANEACTVS